MFDAAAMLGELTAEPGAGTLEAVEPDAGTAAPPPEPPGPAPVAAQATEAAEPVSEPSSGLQPDALPEPWREHYEYRAGVREFDGLQPRADAERAALAETVAARQQAESGNRT